MLRGQARRGVQTGWMRRTIAAGVFVGGALALASGSAAASDCLTSPFGQCPGTASGARGGPAPDVRAAGGRGLVLVPVTPTSTAPVTAGGATSFHIGHTDAPPRGLTDRSRPDRRQAAALAVLAVLVVGTLALRRWAVQKLPHAKRVGLPIAALEASAGPTIEGDDCAEGGRHHLASISSWTRTLEDRWGTMSESDKRLVMEIIARDADEALADMAFS